MSTSLFPDVVVNGEVVPRAAIAAEAQHHPVPKGKPGLAWKAAARALAVKALLLQEARRCGLSPSPEELGGGRRETDEDALIRALVEAETPSITPSEAEVHAVWARDPERFRSPPLWEVSHILCAFELGDERAKAAAYARAQALATRLHADPASFARVAAKESDCSSRASGGSLGQIGPGDTVPEFEAVLPHLAEGEVMAEPVISRFGWHVIRLDAVAQGRALPFDTARAQIAQALEKAAWANAARDLVSRLAADAQIEGVSLA